MTVIVDWLVKDKVIIWESSGKVTGEELIAGNGHLKSMLAGVRERNLSDVHIFVDGYRAYQSPMSIYAMKHWFTYLVEAGFDWHVVCISDDRLKDLCREFVYHFKIKHLILADDLVEGLGFLEGKLDKAEGEPSLIDYYRRWVRIIHEPAR